LFPKSDAERDDTSKLPFSQATGTKLVAIAEHELLSNFSHEKNVLPPDWNTLYHLARLPAPKLKKLIDSGEVSPDLSRAAATKLAKENTVPTSKAKNPKSQQAHERGRAAGAHVHGGFPKKASAARQAA